MAGQTGPGSTNTTSTTSDLRSTPGNQSPARSCCSSAEALPWFDQFKTAHRHLQPVQTRTLAGNPTSKLFVSDDSPSRRGLGFRPEGPPIGRPAREGCIVAGINSLRSPTGATHARPTAGDIATRELGATALHGRGRFCLHQPVYYSADPQAIGSEWTLHSRSSRLCHFGLTDSPNRPVPGPWQSRNIGRGNGTRRVSQRLSNSMAEWPIVGCGKGTRREDLKSRTWGV